jgi:type II secretory pathway pseudopilin PulG
METLLTVAIILIVSSLLAVGSGAAIQGSSQSIKAANTATTLTRIDRHIRGKADAVHIPYWADPAPYIDAFTGELYRSGVGTYIRSVRVISDYRRTPRGVEVAYTVNNREMRTVALFPSVMVMDRSQ